MVTLDLLLKLKQKLIATRQTFVWEERGSGENGSYVLTYTPQERFALDNENKGFSAFAPVAKKPILKALAKYKNNGQAKPLRVKAAKAEKEPLKPWELGLLSKIKKEATEWWQKRESKKPIAQALEWAKYIEKNFKTAEDADLEDGPSRLTNREGVNEGVKKTLSTQYAELWQKAISGCMTATAVVDVMEAYFKDFGQGEDRKFELQKKFEQSELLAEDSAGVDFVQSFCFNFTPTPLKELKTQSKKSQVWSWDKFEANDLSIKKALAENPQALMPLARRNEERKAWQPVTTKKTFEIAEIDLSSAYSTAARLDGIISEESYKLLLKASKQCRLVALGSLATQTKVTNYELVTEVLFDTVLSNNVERAGITQAEAQALAQERGISLEDLIEQESLIKTVTRRYVGEEQPATRPITSPIFFHVAQKVAQAMKEIGEKVGAYFYWVDAIFCHPSKIKEVQRLAKKMGFATKCKIHQSLRIVNGTFLVHKAGKREESPYPVSRFRINQQAAYYNLVKAIVKRQAKTLTQGQFLELCNQRLNGAQMREILQEAGFEDLEQIIEVKGMIQGDVSFESLGPDFVKLVTNEEQAFNILTMRFIENAALLIGAFPKAANETLKTSLKKKAI